MYKETDEHSLLHKQGTPEGSAHIYDTDTRHEHKTIGGALTRRDHRCPPALELMSLARVASSSANEPQLLG